MEILEGWVCLAGDPPGPEAAFLPSGVSFSLGLRVTTVSVARNPFCSGRKPLEPPGANKIPSPGRGKGTGVGSRRKFSSLQCLSGDQDGARSAAGPQHRRKRGRGGERVRSPPAQAELTALGSCLVLFPPTRWPSRPAPRKKSDSDDKSHTYRDGWRRKHGMFRRTRLVRGCSWLNLKSPLDLVFLYSFGSSRSQSEMVKLWYHLIWVTGDTL